MLAHSAFETSWPTAYPKRHSHGSQFEVQPCQQGLFSAMVDRLVDGFREELSQTSRCLEARLCRLERGEPLLAARLSHLEQHGQQHFERLNKFERLTETADKVQMMNTDRFEQLLNQRLDVAMHERLDRFEQLLENMVEKQLPVVGSEQQPCPPPAAMQERLDRVEQLLETMGMQKRRFEEQLCQQRSAIEQDRIESVPFYVSEAPQSNTQWEVVATTTVDGEEHRNGEEHRKSVRFELQEPQTNAFATTFVDGEEPRKPIRFEFDEPQEMVHLETIATTSADAETDRFDIATETGRFDILEESQTSEDEAAEESPCISRSRSMHGLCRSSSFKKHHSIISAEDRTMSTRELSWRPSHDIDQDIEPLQRIHRNLFILHRKSGARFARARSFSQPAMRGVHTSMEE